MKILIVDHSTNWRRFHRNNLKYLGINDSDITSADCAYDALSKIETSIDNPYDVILTDLQMESNFLPKLAGEWLVEQIQTFDEYKNAKITIISACEDIKYIARKLKVNYIPKPKLINSDAQIYKQCF